MKICLINKSCNLKKSFIRSDIELFDEDNKYAQTR